MSDKWDNNDAHLNYDKLAKNRIIDENAPKIALRKKKKIKRTSPNFLAANKIVPLGKPRKGCYLPGGNSSFIPVKEA